MVSQATSPLGAGQVLEIRFPRLTPRITIHSQRELTVEIVAVTTLVSPTLWPTKQSSFAMRW